MDVLVHCNLGRFQRILGRNEQLPGVFVCNLLLDVLLLKPGRVKLHNLLALRNELTFLVDPNDLRTWPTASATTGSDSAPLDLATHVRVTRALQVALLDDRNLQLPTMH